MNHAAEPQGCILILFVYMSSAPRQVYAELTKTVVQLFSGEGNRVNPGALKIVWNVNYSVVKSFMKRPIRLTPEADLECNTPAPIRIYILALIQRTVTVV